MNAGNVAFSGKPMALCEDTGPLARPLFVLDSESALATLIRRSASWGHEASGLARGLAELAWPLRWHLAVVFGFNIIIAIWETVQPFILAWGVDSFEARVPYLDVAAVIVLPVLAISLPQGIVLPFVRDLYAAWFVKPHYEKRVGMLCLERNRSQATRSDLDGKKAPIAQDGRLAAYQLTEMLLRDPAFAIRGLVVLGILLFRSPLLVGILVIGMVADLIVTMLMDARLTGPYAMLREHQFRLRGLEYQLLDGGCRADDGEGGASAYESEWDAYIHATRFVELRRLVYQLPIREGISTVIRIGVMLMVGWWVHTGEVSIGDYILFTSLAGRANDPLVVFLGFQQQIMTTRESLRRLGLLCGIHFGIERPSLAP
jgi:ABC-type multidrug transport system fused ATPase/permease subunit